MASAGVSPRFDVRVVDAVLAEDLDHSTAAARTSIEPVVMAVGKEGVPRDWLRRCEGEGRDGTHLGGCVKFYIPPPAGHWGAVLAVDRDADKLALVLIAVGERHPAQSWRPSVYEIAHRRLHM